MRLPRYPKARCRSAGIVEAPAALGRALSCVGLIETTENAAAAQARLSPGQTLVSRGGGVRRWDGYTVREGTPSAAAARLEQRNRLAACRKDLAGVETAVVETAAIVARALDDERENTAREQSLRAARREAEQRLQTARSAQAELAGTSGTGGGAHGGDDRADG